VNLFTFSSTPPGAGGGQALMNFSNGTPAGSFAVTDLNFGDLWSPNGLQNNFGADIFANINVATTGAYTFNTTSDDGSLLFVDGQLVVNNNFLQGATGRTGSIVLSAGIHLMEVQYFQDIGGRFLTAPLPSGVTFVNPAQETDLNIYSSPVPTTTTFPAVQPDDTFIGAIPTVNLNYGTLYQGSWFPFGELVNFVAGMQGYFLIPSSGSYTFSTSSDDGSWLLIDGSVVVNNDFFQGPTQRSGTVSLTAGYHPFDLQYFQGNGGAALDLGLPAGVTMSSVAPEPGTLGLLALAFGVGGLVYRRAASGRF